MKDLFKKFKKFKQLLIEANLSEIRKMIFGIEREMIYLRSLKNSLLILICYIEEITMLTLHQKKAFI